MRARAVRWTEELKDHVAAMLRDGLSHGTIAMKMGMKKNQVSGAIFRDKTLLHISRTRESVPVNQNGGRNAEVRAKIKEQAGVIAISHAEHARARHAEMRRVIDNRDTTAVLMGDPPRRDPRRTWAPHLAGDQ